MKKILTRGIFILSMFLVLNFTVVYGATKTSGVYTYYELDDGTIRLDGYSASIQNVVIPATIDGKQISQIGSAFKENSTVKTITIPEGVVQINAYAFNKCPNLTNVYFPSTIKSIDRLFCYNCPKLTYTIPENLTKLSNGNYAEIETVTINGNYNYDSANVVFTLVNERRASLGLTPLKYSRELTELAMQRAAETSVYWDHERPNSLQVFSISSLIDGENIGVGTSSPSMIMAGWMNSAGHKRQIISTSNVSIGVGCYQMNGLTFWVQLFSKDDYSSTSTITGKTENVENTVEVKSNDGRLTLNIFGLDSDMSLAIGETKQATKANIVNKGYTSVRTRISLSDIDWSSSDENVFTVDENGLITAVGGGNATLTAVLGESTLTYNVTVESPLVSISLPETITVYTDYTSSLKVTYNPTNTTSNKNVTWSSSNENIVTIDSNGTVKGVNEGTAIITAKVGDKEATCNVIVKKSVKESIYFLKSSETIMISSDVITLDVVFEKGTDTVDDTILWNSSNSDVVAIDDNGNIRTLSVGKSLITATTLNGNVATYEINVIDFLKGDLDRNGVVNANDAAYALDLFKYENATDEDIKIGDMDGDGVINANDAALILDIYKYGN